MEYKGFKFSVFVVDSNKNKIPLYINKLYRDNEGFHLRAGREFKEKFLAVAIQFYINNEFFRGKALSREVKRGDSLNVEWG